MRGARAPIRPVMTTLIISFSFILSLNHPWTRSPSIVPFTHEEAGWGRWEKVFVSRLWPGQALNSRPFAASMLPGL